MNMFNFFEKKAATKPFNFREAYQFLKQEQKSAMFQAIAAYKSAPEAERNSALWVLDDVAKEVLREEKLPTDLETVQEFRDGFLNIPNQSNYTEIPVTDSKPENNTQVETASQDESIEINPASPVMPRRFAPLQPVSPATIITPNIISAQQRGMGVTANPEMNQEAGEAAMERLIAEAEVANTEKASEVYKSPYEGDAPRHVVKTDDEIIKAIAKSNATLPSYEAANHPKPQENLK